MADLNSPGDKVLGSIEEEDGDGNLPNNIPVDGSIGFMGVGNNDDVDGVTMDTGLGDDFEEGLKESGNDGKLVSNSRNKKSNVDSLDSIFGLDDVGGVKQESIKVEGPRDPELIRVELEERRSMLSKVNSEVLTLESELGAIKDDGDISYSLLDVLKDGLGSRECPVTLDSSGDIFEHVVIGGGVAIEVKDEILAEDYWKENSRYLVDMTNANPQDIYSDEDEFNSASPSLVASTPILNMTPVGPITYRVDPLHIPRSDLFDSSSSSDDNDDTGFHSQAVRKRKKELRAVGKSSQHLVLQENIVSKTGEKSVSARIVLDEPGILDDDQRVAIKSIVSKFKGATGDKASAVKKRILHSIAGLLEVEQNEDIGNGHNAIRDDDTGEDENPIVGERVAGDLVLDNDSIEVVDVVPTVNAVENELKNYKFNSDSVLLEDLQVEIRSTNFSRSSAGLRGLVSVDLVSEEIFVDLRIFEVPGLLFDFGQHFSVKDVSRFIAENEQIQPRGISTAHYSLKRLNDYLEENFVASNVDGKRSSAFLSDRRSFELGDNLYRFYSWIDPSVRCLGPNELSQFLLHCDLGFLRDNIAPWPATLFPKDSHDVKYMSVVRNGVEFVCRTMALRQTDVKFYTESSEIFSCTICGDIISTP